MQERRFQLRPTQPAVLPADANEGRRAAWWREYVIRMSRPELADRLGLSARTITNYEESDTVPAVYRLACAALTLDASFHWRSVTLTRDGIGMKLWPPRRDAPEEC